MIVLSGKKIGLERKRSSQDPFLFRRTDTDWVHTGLILRLAGETFQAIEGNTNDEGSREGYEVFKRVCGYRKKEF
jgi:hypothetical protein